MNVLICNRPGITIPMFKDFSGDEEFKIRTCEDLEADFADISMDPIDAVVIENADQNSIQLVKLVQTKFHKTPIILIAESKELNSLKTSLQLTPFIGNTVSCLGVEEVTNIAPFVLKLITQQKKKESFAKLKTKVNHEISEFESNSDIKNEIIVDELMEYAPVGVCILDGEFRFDHLNFEAKSILDKGLNRLKNNSFIELLAKEDQQKLIETSKIVFERQDRIINTVSIETGRNQEIILEYILRVIEKNNEIKYLLILTDVTSKVAIENKLRNYNSALEKEVDDRTKDVIESFNIIQDQMKKLENFIYVASHDLQEPLRTISSYIQLLEIKYTSDLDPTARKFMDFISQSAQTMRDLVLGIVEYSRVGQVKDFNQVLLSKVVDEILFEIQQEVSENNTKVNLGKLPMVNGVYLDIRILFKSIILNAIKFKKQDAELIIDIVAKEKDNHWLVEIRDNGIGIEEKHYLKIFDVFSRLNSKKEYPGSGIGLAQCKKIIEHHKGKIWVESELNIGSSFFFTLPK